MTNEVILSFNEYQRKAIEMAVYQKKDGLMYTTLGLCGEAGEIANKVKKVIRDKGGIVDEQTRLDLSDELGDVAWYLAAVATELELNLEDIFSNNLKKLISRKQRGTLQGSGDKR